MNPQPSRTRTRLAEIMLNLNRMNTPERACDILLDVILDTTPAIRAAVLIENTVWERERSESEPHISDRRGIIDEVLQSGNPFFSDDRSTICIPLDATNGNRVGVLFAEASNPESGFREDDYLLFLGGGRFAA